jgi:hypothetical protein
MLATTAVASSSTTWTNAKTVPPGATAAVRIEDDKPGGPKVTWPRTPNRGVQRSIGAEPGERGLTSRAAGQENAAIGKEHRGAWPLVHSTHIPHYLAGVAKRRVEGAVRPVANHGVVEASVAEASMRLTLH